MKKSKFILTLFASIMLIMQLLSACNKQTDLSSNKMDLDQLSAYLAADSNFNNLILNSSLERKEFSKIFKVFGNSKNLSVDQINLVRTALQENKILNEAFARKKALFDKYPDLRILTGKDILSVFKNVAKNTPKNINGKSLKTNSLLTLKENLIQNTYTDSIDVLIGECFQACDMLGYNLSYDLNLGFDAEVLEAEMAFMECWSNVPEYNYVAGYNACHDTLIAKLHAISDSYEPAFTKISNDMFSCEQGCFTKYE